MNKEIYVWLDDERPMPKDEFTHHVKCASDAIELLKTGEVVLISLDHDLGIGVEGCGMDVAKWIEEHAFKWMNGEPDGLAPVRVRLHTQNPVGKQNMKMALRNAHKYWNNWQDPRDPC